MNLLTDKLNAVKAQASLIPSEHIDDALEVTDAHRRSMAWQTLLQDPPKQGLWHVDGSNGAGRSMLMLALKQRLGKRALLMPAVHDLMFDVGAASSGQRT